MDIYHLMLFVHIISDIGIFVGLSTWLLGFAALRRAHDVSQVRALVALIHRTEPLSTVSSLLTIASGLYMLLTVWGWRTSWALVALGSIVLVLPLLLLAVIEPKMQAVRQLADQAPEGPLPAPLQALIEDRALAAALCAMAATVIGIVFLMTNKPGLAGAIGVMAIAVGLGVASGLLWAGPRRSASPSQRPTMRGE